MDVNFPRLEEEVLERWKREKAFEKSVSRRKPPASAKATAGKRFVFYEGPPTANGKPGIHHVLSRSFKDVILRYKTMRGFFVERRAGWDTHGLPVELQIEKKLGLKSKKDIEKYGIAQFNKECKQSVWEYKKEWESLTERMGFWIDLSNPYITYETPYIETLWHIIQTFWEKGLLYKGHKVVPYCSRCGTPLSSHELAQGYKTVEDTSIYVKFKIKPGQKVGSWTTDDSTYILSWTTTPWTLPGNVALAVGESIKYQVVRIEGKSEHYILARDLAEKILDTKYKILDTISGKDLVGSSYEQLFPIPFLQNAQSHKIYAADFVTTTDGTGVVHTAVMYGEDDYNLGVKVGLPQHHTVTETGVFTGEVPGGLAGLQVRTKETDEKIFAYLKEHNTFLATLAYSHEYPFCWRCSTPLLYFAKDSWFVNMQNVKKELIANNKKINWVPAHLKEGRMGEWLREVKDWAFSRERYWGTPLPIWECKKCEHREVVGSVQELKERAHALPHDENGEVDLHRPYVDGIVFACSQCKTGTMQRVKEVVDVWYDSGAMPFAQGHWPFAKNPKSEIRNPKPPVLFPADYIVEGIDQTRGWFYTLLAVSTLLGFKAPYKNVISFSHVLDEKGEKMSKSKGNVVDPWAMIQKYGIDAVRWYFFTMNNPGDPKLFSEKDIQEVLRKFILTLWNSFVFYQTYAGEKSKIQNPKSKIPKNQNILDKWILSRLNGATKEITEKLDAYDVTGAGRNLENFVINDLSLWYIRRSRMRFQNPASPQDFKEAAATLSFVLLQTCKLAAPFIPFLSEHIYNALQAKGSVHWEDWPHFAQSATRGKPKQDKKLEAEMKLVRDLVTKALAERAKAQLKVRQPLSSLKIKGGGKGIRKDLLILLQDEVNVKEIVFNQKFKNEVELDTALTPELKAEGYIREVLRSIQEMRKEAGYKPQDRIKVWYKGSPRVQSLISQQESFIKKAAGITILVQGDALHADAVKEIDVDGEKIKFSMAI
ncbi:MAG: isoleucine--tRNA ligase [Candidatus Wildermuthbacteria bacterium]|nr:isoleucine--tRNA ligase [Candidatus Wildermuthbacteria bacterium]